MTQRKGIVLAGGSGTRLYPLTMSVSKQLMPIYDKPMVYYPISALMLAGIREILLISTPQDLPLFKKLLEDGSGFGVKIEYAEQPRPEGLAQALIIAETFLAGAPSCLVLGDNLFYGQDFPQLLSTLSQRDEGASILAYRVANPTSYGVVEFDAEGKAISIEEKPLKPKSPYAVPGLYFYDEKAPAYAKAQKPSSRGELEITDLNRTYLANGQLHVQKMSRGTAWLDTGTHDSLHEAAEFVRVIQNRQGLKIACLEEIAYDQGWITHKQLCKRIERLGKSSYAEYLRQFAESKDSPY